MSYPYDRHADFFEPVYLPQIGTNPYDCYSAPLEPGDPLVPYGWRPDWNRTAGSQWSTVPGCPNGSFTALSTSLPSVAVPQTPSSSTFIPSIPSVGVLSQNGSHCELAPQIQPQFVTVPEIPGRPTPYRELPKSDLCRRGTFRAKEYGKPFSCQICGKSFSQAANLTAHRRVHTGEKPFRCNVCNRPFSQSSSLVTHKRTHSGERPYPCAHCEKAFTDSSTLTKHLRTHTGQKPYNCPLCMMRFTQSGNLHRHMKTHKGQH